MLKRRKKFSTPLERLKKSERRLKEFKSYTIYEKLREYEKYKKAIFDIHDVLIELGVKYENQELLNGDYLLADINLFLFLNKKSQTDYITYSLVQKLKLPTGNYDIIDKSNGKYKLKDKEDFSTLIAVDYALNKVCDRWLEEMPILHTLISQKEAGS